MSIGLETRRLSRTSVMRYCRGACARPSFLTKPSTPIGLRLTLLLATAIPAFSVIQLALAFADISHSQRTLPMANHMIANPRCQCEAHRKSFDKTRLKDSDPRAEKSRGSREQKAERDLAVSARATPPLTSRANESTRMRKHCEKRLAFASERPKVQWGSYREIPVETSRR